MIKQNILIVEDENLSAKFLKSILISLGHEVVACVRSCKDSIEIFKKQKVDFIFMDINIEGAIDGILCAKALNKYKEVPIIYVTGFNQSEIIAEASATNIYGYLIKPYDERDIEALLSVSIAKYKNTKPRPSKPTNILKLSQGIIYNLDTQSLIYEKKEILLTKKESQLFFLLCSNLNQQLSYEMIKNKIWEDKEIGTSTIRDTILRIRKKAPALDIDSIAGVGYILRNN